MMGRCLIGLLMFALALVAAPARAHKPSDSYLTLKVAGQQVDGQWGHRPARPRFCPEPRPERRRRADLG